MSLLDRSDQITSQTELARHGKELFARVAADPLEKLVVMKGVHPQAVVVNIHAFEKMQSDLASLRSELLAAARLSMPSESLALKDLIQV
jgi:antitoxin StbD